jgi:hypothetical protein
MTEAEIRAQEQAMIQRAEAQDAAGKLAATDPLPGPLAEAFRPNPDIRVGRWTVRRFVDRDFELLKALVHPLHKMMAAELTGKESDGEPYTPRGPALWQLAWLLTRSVKEAKAKFKASPDAVREAAEDEFGDCSWPELAALNEAALKQMSIYWSPVLGYGPAAKDGETEAAKGDRPFPSTGTPTTGSAG